MTEFDFGAKYRAGFTVSELGRIRALLPLSEMASAIAIRFPKRSPLALLRNPYGKRCCLGSSPACIGTVQEESRSLNSDH